MFELVLEREIRSQKKNKNYARLRQKSHFYEFEHFTNYEGWQNAHNLSLEHEFFIQIAILNN